MTVSFAEAQPQPKVFKIGYLSAQPYRGRGGAREGVLRELETHGYILGKNILFESRHADDKPDRLPGLADELVHHKVDLILTSSNPAALAAKNATRTIPIVFLGAGDPVAIKLVEHLARPGGNITGVTTIGAVLAGKRLELLKETITNLSRISVLWNPKDPSSSQQWKESQSSARELGLLLYSMEVSSPEKYERAFQDAVKARTAALAVTQHTMVMSNQKQVADLAAQNRLPAIYPREDFADIGGLMSYGADRTEPYRRAAYFIDRIIKGSKPADLPVEQPTKFELVINLKTASTLGLKIPPVVLMRADRVIK